MNAWPFPTKRRVVTTPSVYANTQELIVAAENMLAASHMSLNEPSVATLHELLSRMVMLKAAIDIAKGFK